MTEAYFAPRGMAEKMYQAGQAIDAVTDDNDVAVVVDDYGIMSPILLYFMHLKGWSFDPGDISPEVIDNLRRLGARYFVTTQWSNLDARQARGHGVPRTLRDGDGAGRANGHRRARLAPFAVAGRRAPFTAILRAY